MANGNAENESSLVDGETAVEHNPWHQQCRDFCSRWRNVVGFFTLGLGNNYPYVIMLSAAFDIIHKLEDNGDTPSINQTNSTLYNDSCTLAFDWSTNTTGYKPREQCPKEGTSIILLAVILPTLVIKLTAPYWMQFFPYWIKVLSVVLFSTSSFLFVALSSMKALVLVGVVCAAICSGFGELAFLSLTAHYHKSTVTAWSSGTGAAGVAGALVYAALKTFLSPKVTLLVQIYIPVLLLVAYVFILGRPGHTEEEEPHSSQDSAESSEGDKDSSLIISDKSPLIQEEGGSSPLGAHVVQRSHTPLPRSHCHPSNLKLFNPEEVALWKAHVRFIPHLFKYMVPLFLVYFAEYAINQGFFELLYNPNTHIGSYCLDQGTQYRWLQVVYQVGVLISRSSVSIIYVKHFWIFSLLQVVNFVFFFTASVYLFLPWFWLTFFLVLYEGLLGGAVYVNAFYTISKNVPPVHREFSMGVASVADTLGITTAGVASLFTHSFICARIAAG